MLAKSEPIAAAILQLGFCYCAYHIIYMNDVLFELCIEAQALERIISPTFIHIYI